jgi:hypothetical protein
MPICWFCAATFLRIVILKMAAPFRSALRVARRLQHISPRSLVTIAGENLLVAMPKPAVSVGAHSRYSSSLTPQDSAPGEHIDLSKIPGTTVGNERMVIMYTCRVCETRSARIITKVSGVAEVQNSHKLRVIKIFNLQQAYTHGVVLVRCPGCRGLHLVADRLGHFHDASVDIEALLKAKGEAVTRGNVGGGIRLAAGPGGNDAATSTVDPGTTREGSGAVAVDPNVFEFSANDLRVLKSDTKSINLKSGADVHDIKSGST